MSAYDRCMTEMVVYHGHVGVAFPAYHIHTRHETECSSGECIHECSQCGVEITQEQSADTDDR